MLCSSCVRAGKTKLAFAEAQLSMDMSVGFVDVVVFSHLLTPPTCYHDVLKTQNIVIIVVII